MKIRFIFSLMFIVMNLILGAQTRFAGGIISKVEIWSDTVIIEDDVVITNNGVLNVLPGTTVLFDGQYGVSVNGTGQIEAVGTETDSITFTVKDTTGFSNQNSPNGGWIGFDFGHDNPMNNQADSSRLKYCNISYVKALFSPNDIRSAILIWGFSKIIVDRCTIEKNTARYWGAGVNIFSESNSAAPVISNNQIKNNKCSEGVGAGIQIRSVIESYSTASPKIIGNIVRNNESFEGGGGVFIKCGENSTCSPIFINNVISENKTEDANGGGIFIFNSYPGVCRPVFFGNTITNNSAANGGGIASTGFILELEITLENNVIENNIAHQNGGGIYFDHGFKKLYGEISGNLINNNTDIENGGGIYMKASHVWSDVYPDFVGNTITNNHSKSGGGVYCVFGEGNNRPDFLSNIIKNNTSESFGGGLYYEINNSEGNMSGFFDGNVIASNSANGSGGGLYWKSTKGTSKPFIRKNSFANNVSGDDGGGIFIFADEGSCQVKLINNLIYSNEAADDGGGISISADESDATGTIICNTICNNKSGSKGGGLFLTTNNEASSCIFNTVNNILWGNFNNSEENQMYLIKNFGELMLDFNFNCTKNDESNLVLMGDGQINYEGDNFDSTNINMNPNFVNPAWSSPKNDADWVLNWNSPCIEKGIIDTTSLSVPLYDILNNLRFFGNRLDIGSVESQTSIGIHDLFVTIAYEVSPNPSSGLFSVIFRDKGENSIWQVTNSNQKVILSGEADDQIKFDITDHPKGIYFVKIRNKSETIIKKIVKI